MTKALHKLKIEGVKTIELGVDGNNLAALKLQGNLGFRAYKTHFYVFAPSRPLISKENMYDKV